MRNKEEQDTNAHFSGRRNRKRRSIQKSKKDGSNRLSRSMEDLENLDSGAENDQKPKMESQQSTALPYLNHIFKSVPAPRGSVCNSCGKKLNVRYVPLRFYGHVCGPVCGPVLTNFMFRLGRSLHVPSNAKPRPATRSSIVTVRRRLGSVCQTTSNRREYWQTIWGKF